jgi:hypothetical protein
VKSNYRVRVVFYMGYPCWMLGRPTFLLDLRFSDLAEWWLRLERCRRTVDLPFPQLATQKPTARRGVLHALRCRGVPPAPDPGGAAGRPRQPVGGGGLVWPEADGLHFVK